jgi:predicted house-cleaning noncanonical NTP pyrophosphatase (MazG superfamily)
VSGFTTKLAKHILKSESYKETSKKLFSSYIRELTAESHNLEKQEIRKLLLSSQILLKSDDENLQEEGSIILSMILDLYPGEHSEIIPIAKNIFSYLGNFPNISLLEEKFPETNFFYNFYTEAQMDFREHINHVKELDFPLTDYQLALWSDLQSDQDVITSAPTSAGKTYIILNYLLDKVIASDGAFAAIIVPTRALISEVAGNIYELAKKKEQEKELEICTIVKEGEFGGKTFFVMTQERLHEILQRGDIKFDYLFIDEAHNISDKSRGVLLHLTIEKMLEDSFPQIIISMPSPNYQNSFSSIFKDVSFKKEITSNSPVAKIVISVEPKGQQLLISRKNSSNELRIKKGFKGKSLEDIAIKFGSRHSNIIFRNRPDYCENTANKLAERINEFSDHPALEEAANYVEEFIHKNYSLANNLRKGIAFHYGPLPSSIRIMVENLAKDGQIKYITCTSTLAEGVNLPAKNLFLLNPATHVSRNPSERLDDVTLRNITGRAGRMLKHFSGNIFLIEPDTWTFKDYFDKTDTEDKIPTYFKSLNENLYEIIVALRGEYLHDDKDQYRYYTIANKLIREFSSNTLEHTMKAEELTLSQDEKSHLSENIKLAHDNLKVATFTLEANPTVGYIQQNKLFNFLGRQKQFEKWVMPHPKSQELYENLLRVCDKLYEFGIYIPSEGYSLEYICLITQKWVYGNSLKEIIAEQIDYDEKRAKEEGRKPDSVNTSVRKIIKVINNDIRFRLSNALRCYYSLLNNILIGGGIELQNIKIHAFIEVGASDERMINLINLGLTREAAKEIDAKTAPEKRISTPRDLLSLYDNGSLNDIHAITKKEIIKLFSEKN